VKRALATLACAALSLASARATAHPFGLSSTNRLFAIEPDARGARVAFVLDFAELPSTNELAELDRDRDSRVTPAEREAYLDALLARLQREWRWAVDDQPARPTVVARNLEVTPGEGRLDTVRIVGELRVDRPARSDASAPFTITVRDESYGDRPGWRELRAESTATHRATTLEGQADPTVLARRARGEAVTLRMNSARFRFAPTAVSAARAAPPVRRAVPARWIALAVFAAIAALAAIRALRARRQR
jgi:hypothetical protein